MENLEQQTLGSNTGGKKKRGSIFLVLLVIIFAITTFYYYSQLSKLKENPSSLVEKNKKDLIEEVSKLIVLPSEDPTIATVNNPENLKDQPFFANSSKGDRVLIYTNARKAILYNPTSKKIVEVAPLTIGNPAPVAAEEAPSEE